MRELTCIVCPNGCAMQAEESEGRWVVTGNQCKRGEEFACAEITHPVRTVCSTAATAFPETPVVPVRVSKDIPKERIFDVMEEINRIVVSERLERGAVLIHDVLGLGADVIVTSSILSEQPEGEDNYE